MKLRSGTHYKVGEVNRPARFSKKLNIKNVLVLFIALPVIVSLIAGIISNVSDNSKHQSALGNTPSSNTIKQSEASVPRDSDTQNYQKDLNGVISQLGNTGSSFDKNDVDFFSSQNNSLYKSYLSDSNDFCSFGCSIYDRSGNQIRVTCSSYINSCRASDSYGNSANTNCSSYINSCHTYTSNGDSYNTSCSSYINSCSTYGSNGYSSHTSCSNYINSCNTYDSSGNSYNTSCSSYINSCSTYGSGGYHSTTTCSSYISSCNTYGGY